MSQGNRPLKDEKMSQRDCWRTLKNPKRALTLPNSLKQTGAGKPKRNES